MSKITNDGLPRFGTCKVLYIAGICTHMATMGVKGFSRTNRQTDRKTDLPFQFHFDFAVRLSLELHDLVRESVYMIFHLLINVSRFQRVKDDNCR